MSRSQSLSAGESVIYQSNVASSTQPDLRLLHYNDVYHLESGSQEPVGGIARFQTLCNYYRDDNVFKGQPKLVTFFSGDAFNPSLESSVTKGSHMVPVLNAIGTDVACVGNHDLDFGVPQFQNLAKQCSFPWLLANVIDPALGDDVPMGNAKKTLVLESSNGIKIGVIGLVEREWLDTINSLPPNLIYKSATATAKELIPKLREQGAEIIVAVTHAREPNDIKLAENTGDELIDLILGGHDHFYGHSVVNGTHLLRSGTDFKQLSYIKAWRKEGQGTKWNFEIIRQDVTKDIPEDSDTVKVVSNMTSALKAKLEKPIGYTAAPLDARFTTVRLKESNLGNFVCDLMRLYYQADCTIMAGGTIRGDQVYPPGVLRLKDIMNCFPFEDPVVVLKIKGQGIWDALENAVCTYPALEGRFPQVSNIHMVFDPKDEPNSRVKSVQIGGEPLDAEKFYSLATRDYMSRGKDGFASLLSTSNGGTVEELVSDENGMLISMILRQYFMSLKILGRWKHWGNGMGAHWAGVHDDLHDIHPVRESTQLPAGAAATGGQQQQQQQRSEPLPPPEETTATFLSRIPSHHRHDSHHRHHSHSHHHHHQHNNNATNTTTTADIDTFSSSEDESTDLKPVPTRVTRHERELVIMRKVLRKWWRVAGIPGHPGLGHEEEGEFVVGWCKGIAPRVEGRIRCL